VIESDEESWPRPTTPRAVWTRLQARYQQKIDDFEPINLSHTDRSSGRRLTHKFGMIDGKRPTIGQVNFKGTKWLSPQQFSQFFDGHGNILARHEIRVNEAAEA